MKYLIAIIFTSLVVLLSSQPLVRNKWQDRQVSKNIDYESDSLVDKRSSYFFLSIINTPPDFIITGDLEEHPQNILSWSVFENKNNLSIKDIRLRGKKLSVKKRLELVLKQLADDGHDVEVISMSKFEDLDKYISSSSQDVESNEPILLVPTYIDSRRQQCIK